MTSYVVGRTPPANQNRIVISDLTVSGQHCTLTALEDGSCELVDTNSTNGTFVRVKGAWQRISKTRVQKYDEVRLGAYVSTVSDLIRHADPVADEASVAPAKPRFERDPETGEIINKTGP